MPRPRKRGKGRREGYDCPRVRTKLISGHDRGFLAGIKLDPDGLRVAWKELRESVIGQSQFEINERIREAEANPQCGRDLDAIRAELRNPIWAWWEYEAPELRLQVNDGPEPQPDYGTFFGRPNCYRGMPPENMYETDKVYLARLGLTWPPKARATL